MCCTKNWVLKTDDAVVDKNISVAKAIVMLSYSPTATQ